MMLTIEAWHKAAVQEVRMLATDEEANHHCLLTLRDAIYVFEEPNGHNPGPPTTVAVRLQVELFKCWTKQPLAQLLAQLLEKGQ